MSDVIGPNTFNGFIFLACCLVLLTVFLIMAVVDMVRGRPGRSAGAWALILANLLLACVLWQAISASMFVNKSPDIIDILSIPWIALCILSLWLLRWQMRAKR